MADRPPLPELGADLSSTGLVRLRTALLLASADLGHTVNDWKWKLSAPAPDEGPAAETCAKRERGRLSVHQATKWGCQRSHVCVKRVKGLKERYQVVKKVEELCDRDCQRLFPYSGLLCIAVNRIFPCFTSWRSVISQVELNAAKGGYVLAATPSLASFSSTDDRFLLQCDREATCTFHFESRRVAGGGWQVIEVVREHTCTPKRCRKFKKKLDLLPPTVLINFAPSADQPVEQALEQLTPPSSNLETGNEQLATLLPSPSRPAALSSSVVLSENSPSRLAASSHEVIDLASPSPPTFPSLPLFRRPPSLTPFASASSVRVEEIPLHYANPERDAGRFSSPSAVSSSTQSRSTQLHLAVKVRATSCNPAVPSTSPDSTSLASISLTPIPRRPLAPPCSATSVATSMEWQMSEIATSGPTLQRIASPAPSDTALAPPTSRKRIKTSSSPEKPQFLQDSPGTVSSLPKLEENTTPKYSLPAPSPFCPKIKASTPFDYDPARRVRASAPSAAAQSPVQKLAMLAPAATSPYQPAPSPSPRHSASPAPVGLTLSAITEQCDSELDLMDVTVEDEEEDQDRLLMPPPPPPPSTSKKEKKRRRMLSEDEVAALQTSRPTRSGRRTGDARAASMRPER